MPTTDVNATSALTRLLRKKSGTSPAGGAPRLLLSVMMFLQYAIWGAWWVSLGTYLNATGFDTIIGQVYATQGYAAILSPLVFGVIADRFVRADRLLVVLHGCGAVMLLLVAEQVGSGVMLWLCVLGYMLLFMPTLALTNAVAMHHLPDSRTQFPAIRVMGTLGWIAAGLTVGALAAEETALPIRLAAAISAALAIFSLILPNTPPQRHEKNISLASLFGIDALSKVRDRNFWVFIAASLLICIPLAFYYSYTNLFLTEAGIERPAAVQTLGQVSEIGFMLALPFFLGRFGIKWVLLTGMLAWAARYGLFAYGWSADPMIWPLLLGIVLHGICYDFFFVAGQIHIETALPAEDRATGQAFLAFVTLGIGTIIGNSIANAIYVARTSASGVHDWADIWTIPGLLSLATAIFFLFKFRSTKEHRHASEA